MSSSIDAHTDPIGAADYLGQQVWRLVQELNPTATREQQLAAWECAYRKALPKFLANLRDGMGEDAYEDFRRTYLEAYARLQETES